MSATTTPAFPMVNQLPDDMDPRTSNLGPYETGRWMAVAWWTAFILPDDRREGALSEIAKVKKTLAKAATESRLTPAVPQAPEGPYCGGADSFLTFLELCLRCHGREV